MALRGLLKLTRQHFLDVWAAFVSSNMTLMPTPSWVDDSSIQSLAAKGNMDDYCNLAILHFARIVNLLATVKSSSQRNKSTEYPYSQEFKELWSELQTWRELRSKSICPLLNEERTSENPFPTIVFSQSNASMQISTESSYYFPAFQTKMVLMTILVSVCGNTFYHAGSILLLRTGCIGLRITTSDGQKVGLSNLLVSFLITNLTPSGRPCMACSGALWNINVEHIPVSAPSPHKIKRNMPDQVMHGKVRTG